MVKYNQKKQLKNNFEKVIFEENKKLPHIAVGRWPISASVNPCTSACSLIFLAAPLAAAKPLAQPGSHALRDDGG